MKPIILSENSWFGTNPTSTSISKKIKLKSEGFRCNRTSTPPKNHRILGMVQNHTSKLSTLLPWREGLRHHVRWIFICININCPPFILHTYFSDKVKCDGVRLLLQDRVGNCPVCKHRLIFPINVGRFRAWDAHNPQFKSQSPGIFDCHFHCTKNHYQKMMFQWNFASLTSNKLNLSYNIPKIPFMSGGW